MKGLIRDTLKQRLEPLQAGIAYALSPLRGVKGKSQTMGFSDWWRKYGPGSKLDTGELARPFSAEPWVYANVMRILQACSMVPYRQREKKMIVEPDHPAHQFFLRPNQLFSFQKLIEATLAFLLLQGECFWLYEWEGRPLGEPGDGPPDRVWPFPPDYFWPRKDNMGIIRGWEFRGPRGMAGVPIQADEVTRFWAFSPYDYGSGHSAIQAGRLSIATAYAIRLYEKTLVGENAIPAGVLETDEKRLTTAQIDEYLESWKAYHHGPMTAADIAVLTAGMKFKRMGMDLKELRAVELHRGTREEITAIFGNTPGIVGIMEHASYNNLNEQFVITWRLTNMYWMRNIEGEINSNFYPRFYPELDGAFDYSDVPELQLAIETKTKIAESLLRSGWSWREIEDLVKLGVNLEEMGEMADMRFVSGTLLPTDMPPSEKLLTRLNKKTIDQRIEENEGSFGLGKLLEETFKAVKPELQAEEKAKKRRRPAPRRAVITNLQLRRKVYKIQLKTFRELRTFYYRYRSAVISRLHEQLGKGMTTHDKIAAYITEEMRVKYQTQKRLVDAAKENKLEFTPAVKNVDDELERMVAALLPDFGDQLKDFQEITDGGNEAALLAGGAMVYSELTGMGVDLGKFTVSSQRAMDYISDRAILTKNALLKYQEKIKMTVLAGYLEGESVEQIAQRVRALEGTERVNAMLVARQETAGMTQNGYWMGMQDANTQYKGWIHGGGGTEPRDWHMAIDGEVQKIGVLFSIGLMRPHDGPASETMGCTCGLFIPTTDDQGNPLTPEQVFGKAIIKRFHVKLPDDGGENGVEVVVLDEGEDWFSDEAIRQMAGKEN